MSGAYPVRIADEAYWRARFEAGVPEPPVPLLESAHSKRAAPQEIVLECVNFDQVLGLRPSDWLAPVRQKIDQLFPMLLRLLIAHLKLEAGMLAQGE